MELDRVVVAAGRVIFPGATFWGVGRAGGVFTADGVVAAFFSASLRRSSSPRIVVIDFSVGRVALVADFCSASLRRSSSPRVDTRDPAEWRLDRAEGKARSWPAAVRSALATGVLAGPSCRASLAAGGPLGTRSCSRRLALISRSF